MSYINGNLVVEHTYFPPVGSCVRGICVTGWFMHWAWGKSSHKPYVTRMKCRHVIPSSKNGIVGVGFRAGISNYVTMVFRCTSIFYMIDSTPIFQAKSLVNVPHVCVLKSRRLWWQLQMNSCDVLKNILLCVYTLKSLIFIIWLCCNWIRYWLQLGHSNVICRDGTTSIRHTEFHIYQASCHWWMSYIVKLVVWKLYSSSGIWKRLHQLPRVYIHIEHETLFFVTNKAMPIFVHVLLCDYCYYYIPRIINIRLGSGNSCKYRAMIL